MARRRDAKRGDCIGEPYPVTCHTEHLLGQLLHIQEWREIKEKQLERCLRGVLVMVRDGDRNHAVIMKLKREASPTVQAMGHLRIGGAVCRQFDPPLASS